MLKKTLEKKFYPVFSNSGFDELVDEVLRENEGIRLKVISNPKYREFFEERIKKLHKKYGGPLYWGKIVDKWDRVTSSLGIAADLVPGVGTAVSAAEEVGEMIPKSIFALYYGKKTGDWKAIPYWACVEAASFIPVIGDLIDWSNIYIKRARKVTKENIIKEFRKKVDKNKKQKKKIN